MPDTFDPYREALVVETRTLWPDDLPAFDAATRLQLEQALHADAESCGHLEYVRQHSGFCRQITVTPEDLARLGVQV